ncbi:MAG: hypothetical protein V3S26_04230 [Acidimicrobiia bacterium]
MAQSVLPATRAKVERMIADQYGPAFIIDRYAAALATIRNHVNEFWLNHAFIINHQWLFVSRTTGALEDMPEEPDRVQATINRMWPNSRVMIAKLTQREMPFEVNPDAADDATVKGARLAENVLSSTARDHDWEILREMNSWSVLKGGTAAMSISWDADAGHTSAYAADSGEELKGGDTVEKAHSLPQFVVEPGVKDGEKARYWIDVDALPPEMVQAQYGLEEPPSADITAGASPLMRELISTSTVAQSTGGGRQPDLTLVLTYWERPNTLAPEGRWSVVVGNEIVQGHDPDNGKEAHWPFPWTDRLNLVIMRETMMEEEWTGRTIMTAARPIQVMLNAAWSSIIEHMKLAGNARLVVPQSSVDILEDITDLPGDIIIIPDGAQQPNYVQPAQLPGWIIDLPLNLAVQLDDEMGVHDISRGNAPANLESGFALSILAEQDSTPVGRISKEIARAFSRLATMALMLFEQNVIETREATVMEQGQIPMRTRWTGKDLHGQVHAIVPLESIIPKSKVEARQLANDMVEMGMITTMAEFLSVAEITNSGDILEKMDPDLYKAELENSDMAAGRIVVSASFDNHEIHMKSHNNFRKTRRYMMMTAEEKMDVDLHIQGHEVRAAEDFGERRSLQNVDPGMATLPRASGAPLLPEDQLALGPGPGIPLTPDEVIPPQDIAAGELTSAIAQGLEPDGTLPPVDIGSLLTQV